MRLWTQGFDMHNPADSHRPGQEHFFAELDSTELDEIDTLDEEAPATSLWADAWRNLRRRPLFWISSLLILFILTVAAFPGWFTSVRSEEHTSELQSRGHLVC